MILVTKMNGENVYINHSLIEMITESPDTTLKFTNDKCLLVKDTCSTIIERIIEYNRNIFINNTRIE